MTQTVRRPRRATLEGRAHARLAPGQVGSLVGQLASSVQYFVRGYRYAERLPPPAHALPSNRPQPPGPLESYFDAHTEGPGVFKWRHYFDVYERHLAGFRGAPVRVLEIGVFGGGSMHMWREYLGPECQIYGVDIDPECKKHEGEAIDVLIGDQADRSFWERFLARVPVIDVVLDDGGHSAEQQAVTLEALLPCISPGGVYMCEDIHGSFHAFHSFIDGLTRPLSDIGPPAQENPPNSLHHHVASVHRYPLLTVIEKPSWCPPLFDAPHRGTEWPEWARGTEWAPR